MSEIPAAIERFLAAIETADWDGMGGLLCEDVLYDASVPGWHYQYEGRERVLREFVEEWTGRHPWRFVEKNVMPTPDGAVVDFEARGDCPGDENHGPHEEGWRIANIFRLRGDQIAELRFYCCGEWDEDTLRRIEAEAPRVVRRATV